MKQRAHGFLFGHIPDPYVVSKPPPPFLRELPEPGYIAALRSALEAKGIAYPHVTYFLGRRKTPSVLETWRIYRVNSFVWEEQVYIVRGRFSEDDFAHWPAQLRAIWQETMIEVPEERIWLS